MDSKAPPVEVLDSHTGPETIEPEQTTQETTESKQETPEPKQGVFEPKEQTKETDLADAWSFNKEVSPDDVPLALLPQLIDLVNSDETDKQLQGAMLIRKILCVAPEAAKEKEDNPFDAVMEAGVVPRLIDLLRRDECANLQLEAAWALTNLCADSHLKTIVELGAVPHFIRLLDSPSDAAREQAAWGVGNVAGENTTTRDIVLGAAAMEPLLQCTSSSTPGVARNGVWAVSNLCRGKPVPELEDVAVALPVLVPLLAHPDEEVVMDACWAVSYISDGNADRVQRVLNAGALPQIINLLGSGATSLITPALRALGNVASGTTEQVEQLVSNGALPFFHDLLRHRRRAIKKEACWTLSNIAADTSDMIQAMIDTELLPLVIECMGTAEYEIKREALWCIANVTAGGTPAQIRYLVEDLSVFRHFIDMLTLPDGKIVSVALEAIENILEAGRRDDSAENLYATEFTDRGGLDPLTVLHDSANNDVAARAVALTETFFSGEDTVGDT